MGVRWVWVCCILAEADGSPKSGLPRHYPRRGKDHRTNRIHGLQACKIASLRVLNGARRLYGIYNKQQMNRGCRKAADGSVGSGERPWGPST